MSKARLTTAVFGCALALVFFFGNLAPSLAYETVPGNSVSILRLDVGAADRILRVGAQVLRVLFDGEIFDIVTPSPKALGTGRMLESPPGTRVAKMLASSVFPKPKVSRHMLDSILLI